MLIIFTEVFVRKAKRAKYIAKLILSRGRGLDIRDERVYGGDFGMR